jgi:hypothetical protein
MRGYKLFKAHKAGISIVIKPDLEVDPAKRSGLEIQGSTRINPEKLKNIFKVLIFHMKKKIHVNICYTCCK